MQKGKELAPDEVLIEKCRVFFNKPRDKIKKGFEDSKYGFPRKV